MDTVCRPLAMAYPGGVPGSNRQGCRMSVPSQICGWGDTNMQCERGGIRPTLTIWPDGRSPGGYQALASLDLVPATSWAPLRQLLTGRTRSPRMRAS